MGRVIGLLALLNVVVLAAGLSMERVRGQPAALVDFNADKVRLLGRVEAAAAAPAKVAEAMPGSEGQAPADQAKKSAAAAAMLRPRCLAWSGLDEGLLGEVETRLQGAGIAASRYDIHLQTRLGWWVYLPPFADAAATQAAIDAARQKGIKDISPVRGGRMANAVSLGVFPTLATARVQLEKLRALGVQGLRMGPRSDSGNARLTIAADVPEAKLAGLGEGWGKERAPLACAGN